MKAAERAQRRDEILNIAVEVLAERGYRDTSMLEIARRASASKETLYGWFGDKRGLFEAVIRRNAETVQGVLAGDLANDPGREAATEAVLRDFGSALLELLLGESAVAINRAAISEARADPSLAQLLAESGREATLPGFIRFLEQRRDHGELAFRDAEVAAEDFLGLLLGDRQVRRLLGLLAPPRRAQIDARVARAVQTFLRIYGA